MEVGAVRTFLIAPNVVLVCVHQQLLCPLPAARTFSAHQLLLVIGLQATIIDFAWWFIYSQTYPRLQQTDLWGSFLWLHCNTFRASPRSSLSLNSQQQLRAAERSQENNAHLVESPGKEPVWTPGCDPTFPQFSLHFVLCPYSPMILENENDQIENTLLDYVEDRNVNKTRSKPLEELKL